VVALLVCSILRVGQGSPCHDFGGALRVTDGQSGEGPRAVGSPSSLGGPDLDGPSARATIATEFVTGRPCW